MNDQGITHDPIDDYGRTWTSATLATPWDNDFWNTQEQQPSSQEQNDNTYNNFDSLKESKEESKIKKSSSEIIKNVKLTYLSASSLSDDRWMCPICLDIFDDAVESPCCHNLFCEKCILLHNITNEIQNK